jgi:hypothetical protein
MSSYLTVEIYEDDKLVETRQIPVDVPTPVLIEILRQEEERGREWKEKTQSSQ